MSKNNLHIGLMLADALTSPATPATDYTPRRRINSCANIFLFMELQYAH